MWIDTIFKGISDSWSKFAAGFIFLIVIVFFIWVIYLIIMKGIDWIKSKIESK